MSHLKPPSTASITESFADGFVVAHHTAQELTLKTQLTQEEHEKLALTKALILLDLGYSPSRRAVNNAIEKLYGKKILDKILLAIKDAKTTLETLETQAKGNPNV